MRALKDKGALLVARREYVSGAGQGGGGRRKGGRGEGARAGAEAGGRGAWEEGGVGRGGSRGAGGGKQYSTGWWCGVVVLLSACHVRCHCMARTNLLTDTQPTNAAAASPPLPLTTETYFVGRGHMNPPCPPLLPPTPSLAAPFSSLFCNGFGLVCASYLQPASSPPSACAPLVFVALGPHPISIIARN